MLDAPQAPVEDPEIAEALAAEGRKITWWALMITAVATAFVYVA